MAQRRSIGIAFFLGLSAMVIGCQGQEHGAPSGATTTAKSASPSPTTASAASGAPTGADSKPAATSAAAAFPATALPSKALADLTIGVPPGGKLEKKGNDATALETADYRLMLKPAKKDEIAELKSEVKKMPGFKAIAIDQPDGLAVEMEEKGAKEFLITRFIKVGATAVQCESALTKPPKDQAKAKEAFDVCGTIKQK